MMMKAITTACIVYFLMVQGWACEPVRIVGFADKTGSVHKTRTPSLQAEHLEPLIQLVRDCGGELGIGVLATLDYEKQMQTSQSLIRLRLSKPPLAPTTVGKNPIIALRDMAAHKKSLQAWKATADQKIQEFKSQVKPILDIPADGKKTDVLDALARASLFLNEPQHFQGGKAYAVFFTDGQDSAKKAKASFTAEARILAVNGAGVVGILEKLSPLVFESIEASVEFISIDARR